MRTGTIIYVNSGTPAHIDLEDLEHRADYPGTDETCLATSEAEVSWGWWRLLARGVSRVQCVGAIYDDRHHALITHGAPMRLCG